MDLTKDLRVYFPESFNNSIQAAIDAMPATGGTLFLGHKEYVITAGITVNKPITIIGQGGEDTYLQHFRTLISFNSATGDAITISHPGCTIAGIGIKNTAADVTAGSGIKIDIRGTHPTNNAAFPSGVGSNFNIRECTINGFYMNYNIVNAFEWNLTDCMSQNSKAAGIRVASEQLPDGGDGNITGCQILAGKYAGGNAILQNSAGGLKITNTKINQGRHANGGKFADCIVFNPDYSNTPAGVQASTVILLIGSGVSIENFTGYAAKVTNLSFVNIQGAIEIVSYNDISSYFYFDGCSKGMLGGVLADKSGKIVTNFAQFVNCSDWDILSSRTNEWGVDAYVQTGCSNMRFAPATSV